MRPAHSPDPEAVPKTELTGKSFLLAPSRQRGAESFVAAWLFLALCTAPLHSETIVLKDKVSYDLGPCLSYIEDPGRQLHIEDIHSIKNWKLNEAQNLGLGYSSSAFWIKCTLANDSDEELFLLDYGYPNIGNLDLFVLSDAGKKIIKEKKSGFRLPFALREIYYQNFLFRLPLQHEKTYQLVLRIESEGTLQAPLTIWKPGAFLEHATSNRLLFGFYYGIMGVMFLFNLFIFLGTGDRSYAYYVAYVASYSLFQLSFNGLAYQYLWPDATAWANTTVPFFGGIALAFIVLFSRSFLNTRQILPVIDKVLLFLLLPCALIVALSQLAPYSYSARMVTATPLLVTVMVIVAGFMALKRGFSPARYFLFAWSAFMVGMFAIAARNLGLLPSNFLTDWSMQIGSSIEVTLLSIALADRFNQFRREKEATQQEIISMQEEANRTLEARVEERTRELMIARNKAEASRDEVMRLNEFSRIVNSTTRIDDVLKHIYAYIFQNLPIEGAWFLRIDQENRELATFKFNLEDKYNAEAIEFLKNFRAPLSPATGTLYRTYKSKRALYIREIPEENTMSFFDKSIMNMLALKSFLQVPLVIQENVVGIVCFSLFDRVMKLSRAEFHSILRFCDQIAAAIYTTSLFDEVQKERANSDRLLLNILPQKVARELKEHGHVTPVLHNSVSIMFADLVGFTQAALRLSPRELVEELDNIFASFDLICERNNVEKLKTIGDSYMAAAGLPAENSTHAIDLCLTALEMLTLLREQSRSFSEAGYWRIRIGIHTGPAMAGVIGRNKFAYDVWGDSVNICARLESSGDPGRIHISESTHSLLYDFFACEERGLIELKNRGQLKTYFLNALSPEYSRGGPWQPNSFFKESYAKIKAINLN